MSIKINRIENPAFRKDSFVESRKILAKFLDHLSQEEIGDFDKLKTVLREWPVFAKANLFILANDGFDQFIIEEEKTDPQKFSLLWAGVVVALGEIAEEGTAAESN